MKSEIIEMKIDFNKPAHLIDTKKELNIQEIKYVLNNIKWERYEYFDVQNFWRKQGVDIADIDFDLIEAFQNIFKHCASNPLLGIMAYIFNSYVKVTEDIGLYEPYGPGEDKIYSCGYDLELNVPEDLKQKILNISKNIAKKKEDDCWNNYY